MILDTVGYDSIEESSWDDEKKLPEKKQDDPLLRIYQEFSPATVCVLIARVALKIFRSNYFEVLFIGTTAFLITAIVKKLFYGYTPIAECEKVAIAMTREWPQLHVASGVASILFIKDAPFFFVPLVASIGAFTALAFRIKWQSASADT